MNNNSIFYRCCVIFNTFDDAFENVIENIDDLSANILYMIVSEKVVKEDVEKVIN